MKPGKSSFFSSVGAKLDAAWSGLSQPKSLSGLTRAFTTGADLMDWGNARSAYVYPYKQSPWIFSAINLVSGEFTGLPLCFYADSEEFDDAALAAWWAAPALGPDRKRLTRTQVDQLLALHTQLHGEFFILLDVSWSMPGPRTLKSPFIIARPDRMRLIIRAGELEGYAWTDAGGRQQVFLPEEVIHKMEPNPYDDWRGLGRAEVAKVAAEGIFLTGIYVRELMRNNGDQGYIVIGKNGIADPIQQAQIIEDLRAKRQALRLGIARDVFLTGDISVDHGKEQAAGADLTATTTLSHQEVFVTFGVPPSMSTVKASYSIGKDSDRYQLITGTSMPLSRRICGAYAELASRQTGQVLTAEHDWDDHPVMQEVRRARIEIALKLWGSGMAWQDINDYLDLGMVPFPGWEIPYLPFSVVPVAGAAAADPVQDPAMTELGRRAQDIPEVATLRLLLIARTRSEEKIQLKTAEVVAVETEALAAFTCNCGKGVVAQQTDRPPAEIAQWRASMVARRESMASYKSAFGRLLTDIRVDTLRNIEGTKGKAVVALYWKTPEGTVVKGVADDLLFDLSKFKERFTEMMRKQANAALNKAGEQLFGELGRTDPFSFAPHDVLQFLGDRENKTSSIPDDIFGKIKSSLQEGLDAGESTDDLAARARSEFNSLGKVESQRLAQTEVSACYGFGRHEAMRKAGIKSKRWLTSGNANMRPTHAEANGQTVALDEPFLVGGEDLQYPGDSNGSPGEVINCHCVSIATNDAPDSDS